MLVHTHAYKYTYSYHHDISKVISTPLLFFVSILFSFFLPAKIYINIISYHFFSIYSHKKMVFSENRISLILLCLWVATISLFSDQISAEFQRFEHPTRGDGTLRFLVVGDWGRKGEYNQSQVAFQMGRIGDELDVDFVVSTGDNFYDNGLEGETDPAFVDSYTNIYTAKSLQKQWFSVLGNHDYRGDVIAQLSPVLRKIDSRWLCLRSFVVNAEIAELFFVDTTPFVEDYFTNPEDHTYDWRGVTPVKSYIANTLRDLETALKESTAKWKIVVGHHAIRSVGHHGDTQELVDQLLPILQANNVDLYVNGHDHCLERISDTKSPIQFLTSGAGSKAWRGDLKNMNHHTLKFFYDGQGFMFVKMTQSDVAIVFYDVYGQVLHKWTRSKQLHPVM